MYLRLIHVDVWRKPSQYCRGIILQLKIKLKKKKNLPADAGDIGSRVQSLFHMLKSPYAKGDKATCYSYRALAPQQEKPEPQLERSPLSARRSSADRKRKKELTQPLSVTCLTCSFLGPSQRL